MEIFCEKSPKRAQALEQIESVIKYVLLLKIKVLTTIIHIFDKNMSRITVVYGCLLIFTSLFPKVT